MFFRQIANCSGLLRLGAASCSAAVMGEISVASRKATAAAVSRLGDWDRAQGSAACRQDRWASTSTAAQPSTDADDEALLEVLRFHNTSLPHLEGQVVKGVVVQADKRTVMIDVGYKSMQRFFRSELEGAPIYSADGVNRGVPTELLVGDVMHFKFRELETVFGDMQLDVHTTTPEERKAMVLEELKQAVVTQTPVMGRVLNPVMRGYAVGIGGVVAFCPMTQCLYRTAQRVGVLQPFQVVSVRDTMTARGGLQPNIVVVDATKRKEEQEHTRQRAQARHETLRAQREAADRPAPDLGRTPTASMYLVLQKARAARAAASSQKSAAQDLKSRVGADLGR